jgi:hypothetical protein
MSISGIPGSPYPTTSGSIGTAVRSRTEPRPLTAPASPHVPDHAAPVSGQTGASAAMPVQPPPGTDPTLWNVLNSEERAYFAKVGAMGPLTYGRVLSGHMSPPTPDVRGGRLDLKI